MTCSECKRPFDQNRACLDPFRVLCDPCKAALNASALVNLIVILLAVFLGAVWLSN